MFFKVGCALESTGGLVKRDTKLPRCLDSAGLGRAWEFSFLSSSKMMPVFLAHGPFLEYTWDKLVLRVPFSPPIPGLSQDHSMTWLSYGYAHSRTWKVFMATVVWVTIPLQIFSYTQFICKWTLSWCWLTEAGLLWRFAWILNRSLLDPVQLWPLFTSPTLLSCHPKKTSVYLHWSI